MEMSRAWGAASFASTQDSPNIPPPKTKKSKAEARCDIRLSKQTI
jgi:hypothetical protein